MQQASASFEPTFMAIGKILDLGDKISAGGIFGVHFEKNQKTVKNVSKKNLYCMLYD